MNISNKNKITGKPPQLSNWAFTYPVPVNIDMTLNKIALKLNEFDLSKTRYIVSMTMLKRMILIKVLI